MPKTARNLLAILLCLSVALRAEAVALAEEQAAAGAPLPHQGVF